MYSAGDCIIIETDHYPDGLRRAHLFVVIHDAKQTSDNTILIPMCTIQRGYNDLTTVLDPGDHDFVKKPSYMKYSSSRIKTKAWIDSNGRKREPPVGEDLLLRIRRGICASDQTPKDIHDKHTFWEFDK